MRSIDRSFASLNELQSLPAFAAFLLAEKLNDYCQVQLQYSNELAIPVLKFFSGMEEQEMLTLIRQSAIGFLTLLSQNKAADLIEEAIDRWKSNHLPVVDRHAIVAEDLTLISYLRKKTLLHFLPSYSQDPSTIVETVKEMDLFLTQHLTIATNTYMDLLKERLEEHSHFIEKVNETLPGSIYVFDRLHHKGVYSNNKLASVIGYEQVELNELGENAVALLVHPEDQGTLRTQAKDIQGAKDGEVVMCRYRIKDKKGSYRWMSSHEAVFKRKDDGTVWQTIGITLNIDSEQNAIAEKQNLIKSLSRSEALYRKAEEIANMGNWVWYPKRKKLEWTDQLYRIYGLEPKSETVTIERFLSLVHPDDRAYVQAGVDELYQQTNVDYTFRIVTPDGTVKWLRSIAHVLYDDKGTVSSVMGIEQDVTEKQKLINKLEESQRLYKQAQELAMMGNFSWDLSSNQVFWSDEVYKIYDRTPGEQVRFDDAFTPIVNEDKERVQRTIADLMAAREGQSVSFAIRKGDGTRRYINLHTDVVLNKDGNVGCIVGTAQDVTEKEELINRLQQSERLYKQAQSLSHLGNWTYDIVSKKFSWSDEMFQIYERPHGTLPDLAEWHSYLDVQDKERILTIQNQAVNEKKPLDIVHSIHLPSGKTKILHRRGEVVCDVQGNPVTLIGTTQDITSLHQVQAELAESQAFIRKIADATPSIIATFHATTGKYTYISEGVEKLLGYKSSEILDKGMSFFQSITHPDDLTALMEKNQEAIDQANSDGQRPELTLEFTYRVKHRNGSYRWLHTYGTVFDYNQQGKVEHILNISLDVTSQMEATEKIKEQEHFIQQIADASPTILYLFDVPSQSLAYINREAFFVLGYLPDEILEEGSGITNFLYHPEDIALLPCRRQSAKTFQQVDSMIQYECRLKHKDGEYRWLLVREIVFKTDDAGNIVQIIGAALDINRRKEMERTILQNTLQLEQSNASLEEFAYVASHDLKEPLRKISTFGDRLMASQLDRLSDDGKVYLRKIVDASQRMQNMISDLLSISMISGNRAFEVCSLHKILEETVQTLEFKIENQHALVRFDSLPEASIIPSQFRQLFQNLLSNSLKFVREGVQPVITVSCSEADPYELAPYQLAKAERYLKLVFADNGIGFENEFAQKIFAIFQRLHGRSEYEGSGIGLSICKKIVEHHGGVIFAQGKPEQGATFTIILPA